MHKVMVEMDPDVVRVCDFMMYGRLSTDHGEQREHGIETGKLVAVAKAVAALAPVLWGHYTEMPSGEPPLMIRRAIQNAPPNSDRLPLLPTAT